MAKQKQKEMLLVGSKTKDALRGGGKYNVSSDALDALNSQVFCMGVEELGSRFAGDITFWGEIDRQQILPRASTGEIAQAAGQMRSALHREGGLIAQCEFGPGARPENIYAFFQALT